MKRIGWGLWLKSEVTLSDVLVVYDLARAAHGQSFFVRLSYYARIVGQLTGKHALWRGFFVNRVLQAADMLGGEKTTYDPKEKVLGFVHWLAPRVGLSPHAILHELNGEELQRFASEAISYHSHRDTVQAFVQHMPKEYFAEIQKLYDFNRDDARKARAAEIAETEEQPDTNPISMLGNAFEPGAYHG